MRVAASRPVPVWILLSVQYRNKVRKDRKEASGLAKTRLLHNSLCVEAGTGRVTGVAVLLSRWKSGRKFMSWSKEHRCVNRKQSLDGFIRIKSPTHVAALTAEFRVEGECVCLCVLPPNTLSASCRSVTLIERPPAVLSSAQTRDLLVLDGELVVVGDLLVDVDRLARVDYNLLLRLHRDHLGVAVRLWSEALTECQ